jgi:cardiolipin synthase
MGMKKTRFHNQFFTIPNILSYCRFLLIPVFLWLYCAEKAYITATWIMAISAATDVVDGWIARHFNMISTVGKILDPLADKATQFSLILCLAVVYPVLRFLVVLFFVKEIFQLVAGIINLRKGKMLKGALITGKICTTVLFVSLILMVMFPQLPYQTIIMITAIDILFLLISFIDYLCTYLFSQKRFQSLDDNQ